MCSSLSLPFILCIIYFFQGKRRNRTTNSSSSRMKWIEDGKRILSLSFFSFLKNWWSSQCLLSNKNLLMASFVNFFGVSNSCLFKKPWIYVQRKRRTLRKGRKLVSNCTRWNSFPFISTHIATIFPFHSQPFDVSHRNVLFQDVFNGYWSLYMTLRIQYPLFLKTNTTVKLGWVYNQGRERRRE